MISQQPSNILNHSDIIDEAEKLTQNNSIIQQMFKELSLSTEYPDFSSVDYWNNRYSKQKDKFFEWLQTYSTLQPFIHNCLFGRFDISQILYVGCGNSQLQDYMQLDGIKNIRCVDFSDVLIRQKQQQTIPYYLMDVTTKIDFEDEEFDFIIDKCLLDSLMSGSSFFERVSKYLSECYRILKPNGTFMIISYGHPDIRTIYLKLFKIQIIPIEKTKIEQFNDIEHHYIYMCTK
ncbi:unnamed protein product (macronuclear) [Paramecium tetraurelia]|uniref:Methyltransferase type 11 domain-containing protein n=1 Tax=Paramecium tetraurelia TaxID=5888 RepID=A0D3L1_PARTE|nr:uncharacterized protein GSPATT00013116001 [Paramecium tetraurelia]CAK77628.1 unnamed protein product [Paramecium tetraurelia]|eukprot:XP_001445025.1 hypothetical protein (macronuclear) [Paramecium tetraurelia strain d4-2]